MTALDVVCTWIGRLWAGCALIVVASVLLAVASEGLRKRRDVRKVRRTGYGLFRETPPADHRTDPNACGCADCLALVAYVRVMLGMDDWDDAAEAELGGVA